ncbi:MAG TPA: hypothetical protein VF553_03690 [Pyrinomonadaceae bacterium]|jgi:hypothetical protein
MARGSTIKINRLSPLFIACCFLISAGSADCSPQASYQIIPRVRVGAITPATSEAALKRIYGRRNVRSTRVSLGEGEYEPGTSIYPDDPARRIEIVWKDARRKRFPKRIQLTGEKSIWRTREGISLGTRLRELERINGEPFVLLGFSWDYEGTIVSWEGGRLEREFGKDDRAVLLRLSSDQTYGGVSDEDASSVLGDREFPSSNPVMQRINPKVYQIIVEFP